MNKNKFTIAIPAHNEANNLPHLLENIKMSVASPFFELSGIVLISDGSQDNTPRIIRNFKYNSIKIHRIIDPQRRGKIYRLNQIFSRVKTKYLLILDADIRLHLLAIKHLLEKALDSNSVLTVSHQIPVKPSTFIGNIIYTGYRLWDEIRTSNNKYLDNSQNFYGAASVYTSNFYQNLVIPVDFHDERKFIYYSAKQIGDFKYVKNSYIYYHPVSTLKDFSIQSGRSDGIDLKINKYFNPLPIESKIPTTHKLAILGKYLIRHPFKTTLFLIMKYLIKSTKIIDPLTRQGMWTITSSTKAGF